MRILSGETAPFGSMNANRLEPWDSSSVFSPIEPLQSISGKHAVNNQGLSWSTKDPLVATVLEKDGSFTSVDIDSDNALFDTEHRNP